jgi:hypothetical protein
VHHSAAIELRSLTKDERVIKILTVATMVIAAFTGCAEAPPEAKDIQAELIYAYSACTAISLTEFEKTNSVDRGDHYKVDLTWKFTVLRDLGPNQLMLPNGEGLCKNIEMTKLVLAQLMEAGVDIQQGLEKGLTVGAANTFNVEKSEKGWILK